MTVSHLSEQELVLTHVTARLSGAIGELELTRTESGNALNDEMSEEILLASQWLDMERQVKVVIIHGAGEAFCAKLDPALLQSGMCTRRRSNAACRATGDLANQLVERMAGMKAIVVGAIHGACVGSAGIMLAAACDLRYAARDTRFLLPEAESGIPAMHTALRFLALDLGPSETLAATLLQTPLTAQALYDAAFLNDISEPGQTLDKARAIAVDLARKPALILRKSKQHLVIGKHELIRAAERHHPQVMG